MRVAAHVLLAYLLILVVGSVWRFVPLGRVAPDMVALCAVYLGLTARSRLASAALGAIVLGYLGDLLVGTPRGMLALTAGILCIVGQLIHRRLLVRGVIATFGVALVTGLASGLIQLALRAYARLLVESVGREIAVLLGSAALTALAGPLVFRLLRALDARFTRGYRDRDTP